MPPRPRAGLFVMLAVSACGTASALPPRAPAPRPPSEGSLALASGAWGDFVSKRFDLRLPLPDGPAWRIDDRKTPWLTASHAASSSTLLVRAWREADLVNRSRCEARARSWMKLPEVDGAQILEERTIPLPAGFDTRLVTGVSMQAPAPRSQPPHARAGDPAGQVLDPRAGDLRSWSPSANGQGESIQGFAMAFGGWAHRCFAYVYRTEVRGADAVRLIGERLATMVEGSLFNIELQSPLTPSIPKEAPPDEVR